MNTPGLSIFQGGGSIHLDNSINRAEEEEDLEDKKRRDEELNKDLQTAFDDLIDDDDNTIDSSNFQSDLLVQNSDKHIIPNGIRYMGMPTQNDRHPQNHVPCNNINLQEETIQKLKMLLDSKTHELENVTRIAHEEKKLREDTEKRLAMSEAERERAIRSKKSHHELLVESKEKCSNLENTIQNLKSEIKSLEVENNELNGKLETSQNMLADVQHKYNMVEKNINTKNDRNVELNLKRVEERHRAEMAMLQAHLDSTTNKLEKKTLELENMNSRYKSLQQSHENMLIEKSSKISELDRLLTEAQKQCEELRCKHDYSQENVRLQRLVAELQRQIENMEGTIEKLRSRLEQATADINAMDSVFQQNYEESFRRLSQTQGRVVESTPLTGVERANNLKEELCRAMSNLKNKREEIREMQKAMDRKDHEIKYLKQEENRALVKITTCQEENTRLKNKLKLIEEELDELRAKSVEDERNLKQTEILDELMCLKEERKFLQNEIENMKHLKLCKEDAEKAKANMAIELRMLDSKVKDLQVDLEELKQERDSLKANYKQNEDLQSDIERLRFRLEDSQKECDRLKNLYVEISNEKEAIAIELKKYLKADFCKDLQEQREECASLNKALKLAEIKCSELTKILETQKISYEKDLSQLREKLENEKADRLNSNLKNSSNNCAKCIEYVAECTKLEIQILKLTSQCTVYQKEIGDLNYELNEAKNHIADLSDKIVLIDEREKLIVELKAKAQQFEEYIKLQSSSGASSLKQTGSEDKSVETSPELESKFNRRQVESKVRDEMAKIFAAEIRNNEQRYKVKTAQLEDELESLRKSLQKINSELIQRHNEVQVLKHAILSEREKTEEVIANKDKEYKELFEKQNLILHKSRDELKLKTQRINELLRELDERNHQIEAERQSMKAVMTQWEEQRRKSDNIQYEWENKIEEMKRLHEAAIASWQTKYNSAKKTAVNYKRYAEDKENHMIQEYNRIKSEYDASLAKIEIRMKEAFEKKSKEMKEAIAVMEKNKGYSKPITDGIINS
ncbi:synaptonemal complex protein 1 [Episyrphus balteatus]|uniref:synaptonemal complex protein 1 n=1 Tax=Episyrphus balteatus TaxID=286459 RepID=UPI002485E4DE|nr:synaptonemal complex protein 1 [Episyrphus balteatus]